MGLPISSVAVRANSARRSRNIPATRRSIWARSALSVSRQRTKAARAASSAACTCSGLVGSKTSISSPVAGFTDWILLWFMLAFPPFTLAPSSRGELRPCCTDEAQLVIYCHLANDAVQTGSRHQG